MQKITFSKNTTAFFPTLQKSVNEYFKTNKLKPTGNMSLYAKTLILVPSAIALYVTLVFFTPHPAIAISLAAILGLISASIGFSVMHDACHGSYSTKKWVNEIIGLTLNALGGNAFLWKQKHNEIHHTYTNVDGADEDIAKIPLLRQCHTQPFMKIHTMQHLYIFVLYGFSSIIWIAYMDFIKYFQGRILNTKIHNMDTKEHVIFWASKVLYAIVYIAVPIYFVGVLPWLVGFFAMHFVMGLMLGIVFQLAHVVEITHFEQITSDSLHIESEWAIHQINTTANFARNNKIVNWYVGGLNYQVEHHLFPRISHVHYPAISKIVERVCKEFNVTYNDFPTMWSAIGSHYRFMRELGKPEKVKPLTKKVEEEELSYAS
ncbi:MAG: acyl-CoA desaturase [Bacteroidota bacterium]|nr:acyl-CoA desaturase [Bacteroidota bacterium]